MRLIRCVSNSISGNIREAREKILKAYELRGEDAELSMWFREMAAAHLAFNDKGHAIAGKLINAYRMSDAYKEDPSYADGMTAVWNDIHTQQTQECAEVRAMIDSFK